MFLAGFRRASAGEHSHHHDSQAGGIVGKLRVFGVVVASQYWLQYQYIIVYIIFCVSEKG